jgi:MFS family permease
LRHRGKWQSYFEISNVVSAFAGPAIAGAVTGFSWRYSYAILAGMGILSAVPVVWKLRLASVQVST